MDEYVAYFLVSAKKFPFSPGANLGGFGLLENGEESTFEIMGQGGVFPAIYPHGAKTALGWRFGRN